MSSKKLRVVMKNAENSRKLFSAVVLVFLLLSSINTFAQPDFDDDVNDEKGAPDPAPATPIDSNILYLSVAGAALGIYFLRKKQKLDIKI